MEVTAMPSQSVAKRLDQLEKAVKSLVEVPTRHPGAELQFLQRQRETRDEISAIRSELAMTRADLEAAIAPLATREELAAAIAPLATKEELAAAIAPLATRSEMLILHEDLVERLKTLGDLWRSPRKKRR
jgi:hypothetical protein